MNTRTFTLVASLVQLVSTVSLVALAGCQSVRPTDMTISEHKAAAQTERNSAEADRARYDPDQTRLEMASPPSSKDAPSFSEYNPTQRYLAQAAKHEQIAKAHERAADKLAHFEDAACKPFSAAVRSACPVLGPVTRIDRLADGARVELVNAGEADAIAQHIRCHVAFGNAHGESAVEGCPLYIKGLTVKVKDGALLFHVNADDVDRLNQELAEHVTK